MRFTTIDLLNFTTAILFFATVPVYAVVFIALIYLFIYFFITLPGVTS